MIGKKAYFENKDCCTFGVLRDIWDNGYIKIAYIKFPSSFKTCGNILSTKSFVSIDFKCCLLEEVKIIS